MGDKVKRGISTDIRKTLDGHQVLLTIDHQTFFLSENLPEDGFSSKHYAKWYKEQLDAALEKVEYSAWIAFDHVTGQGSPPEYGKYWVGRKDGKVHSEIWNNTGWAHNNNSIKYWRPIPVAPSK